MQTSAVYKLVVMGVLFMVMLVPITMIHSLVGERASRRNEASAGISGEWGHPQQLAGPILVVPFRYFIDRPNAAREAIEDQAAFLPQALATDVTLVPEIRKRGLFAVVVYRATVRMTGRFRRPDVRAVTTETATPRWDAARLSVAISDPRGISGPIQLSWNGAPQGVDPGVASHTVGRSGISAPAPGLDTATVDALPFVLTLELNGTQSLQLLPFGNDTSVVVRSTWRHPGFDGAPLPYRHTIDENGFTAEWRVPHFGRGFPAAWRISHTNHDQLASSLKNAAFGVTLVQPVDIYQQAERAVKYAVLFIVMTFVIAFLWEIIGGVLVHPMQYLFIGFALSLFYLLLLAISEHVRFDLAYLAAATPTVLLISWYWQWVIGTRGRALLMLGSLSGLYAYLYLLLRLEDYALLAGAVGLFMMLAAVMFLTRRVDWYNLRMGSGAAKAGG